MIQPITPDLQHQPIWFVAIGSEQKGPYAIDQLKEMVKAGTLGRTALVWTKGMPKWEVAESTELVTYFKQLSPLSINDISKDTRLDETTVESGAKVTLTESESALQAETNTPKQLSGAVNEKSVSNNNLRRPTWWTQSSPVFILFIIFVIGGIAIVGIGFVFGFPNAAAYTIGRIFGAFALPCVLISLLSAITRIFKKKLNYGFQYFFIGGFGLLFTLLSILGNDGGFNSKNLIAMLAPFAVGIALLIRGFVFREK